MPWVKQIQPDEKVGLKLTRSERMLLLDKLMCLDIEYDELIRATPPTEPIMLTLEGLDDFGGYVAAEANHTPDKKLQKKLDKIFLRIQGMLEIYSDEPPPQILTIDRAPEKAVRKSPTKPTQVFQFKITLIGFKPVIWRRIQVVDCTLDKLHEHIQTAMGWTNSHLHHFMIAKKRYGDPELLDDDFNDFKCIDSTVTKLSKILPKDGKRFRFQYEYDFGDGWEHEILFEGCPAAGRDKKFPLCIDGAGSCPPEDVGGVWGYAEFLEAITNPKHERHDEFREWSGPFDADAFDAADATKAMKKGLPNWRN
jgi:hypothetical protein